MCWLVSAHAAVGYREIRKTDSRLPETYAFTDVVRERTSDKKLRLRVIPPAGSWSTPIRCPGNDAPTGFKAQGGGVFKMPGGVTYIEYGEGLYNEFPGNIPSWGVLLGDRDFYATSFSPDSRFSIYCPLRNVVSTRYEYIQDYNADNTLPLPGCSINGDAEICRVLHPQLVENLSKRNWRFNVSVRSHIEGVQRYNAKVTDGVRAKTGIATRSSILKTVLIIAGVIGLLLVIGYVQRMARRQM